MTTTPVKAEPYQIMPLMTPEQFAELKEDIKYKGVLQPIEFDDDGNIIDGHHRHRAFSELINEGVDLPMYDKITRKFPSEEAKVDFVISFNVKRRHLTAEQRQELVVTLRKPPYSYTMQKIADLLSTSIATVSRDIDDLSDEDKAELKKMQIAGADGRTYSADRTSYDIKRAFYTGNTQLAQAEAQAAGATAQAAAALNGGIGISADRTVKYAIMIECGDEIEQAELLERLLEEGLTVRALVL